MASRNSLRSKSVSMLFLIWPGDILLAGRVDANGRITSTKQLAQQARKGVAR
jgi:hypothetical protein